MRTLRLPSSIRPTKRSLSVLRFWRMRRRSVRPFLPLQGHRMCTRRHSTPASTAVSWLDWPSSGLHLNDMPSRTLFRTDSRGAHNELPLSIPPAQLQSRSSPGPFRGGPPPPVIFSEDQRPSTHGLASMDVDRPPICEAGSYRDAPRGDPSNTLLLHHPPQPQQISQSRPHENFAPRPIWASPSTRTLPAFSDRPPVGPGQMPHPRSPRAYTREMPPERAGPGWDRHMPPGTDVVGCGLMLTLYSVAGVVGVDIFLSDFLIQAFVISALGVTVLMHPTRCCLRYFEPVAFNDV